MPDLTFTNPLPRAFAHYVCQIEQTLGRCSVSTSALPTRVVEGKLGVPGRIWMLANSFRNARDNRNGNVPNLQLWPSLGLLEARLWGTRSPRNIVAIHDPVPLRAQVGYGRVSAWWASRAHPSHAPIIMVHSTAAQNEVRRLLPHHNLVQVLLPVLSHQTLGPESADPLVVVAGQYKKERNLDLLAALGPSLVASGLRPEIHGAGWPTKIPGWTVHDGFLTEEQLESVLSQAWVVLLPYRRYFQSGIAIRALEQGTLTVGTRTGFTEDLLGPANPSIVDDLDSADDWHRAITETIATKQTVPKVFADYRARVDDSWLAGIRAIADLA